MEKIFNYMLILMVCFACVFTGCNTTKTGTPRIAIEVEHEITRIEGLVDLLTELTGRERSEVERAIADNQQLEQLIRAARDSLELERSQLATARVDSQKLNAINEQLGAISRQERQSIGAAVRGTGELEEILERVFNISYRILDEIDTIQANNRPSE